MVIRQAILIVDNLVCYLDDDKNSKLYLAGIQIKIWIVDQVMSVQYDEQLIALFTGVSHGYMAT